MLRTKLGLTSGPLCTQHTWPSGLSSHGHLAVRGNHDLTGQSISGYKNPAVDTRVEAGVLGCSDAQEQEIRKCQRKASCGLIGLMTLPFHSHHPHQSPQP